MGVSVIIVSPAWSARVVTTPRPRFGMSFTSISDLILRSMILFIKLISIAVWITLSALYEFRNLL